MIKYFAFVSLAFFGFAPPTIAANPFDAKAVSNAPSVLEKSEVGSASAVVSGEAAVAQEPITVSGDQAASEVVSEENKVADAAPISGAEPAMASAPQYAPVYRTTRPSRKQNGGLFSELIELEKRKNAWLRKNILGR